MASFDRIAPVYDTLAHVIFGKRLETAASCFFDHIESNSHILILGGGTGQILEQLDAMERNLDVTFVEQSLKMITKAQARTTGHLSVRFEHADARTFESEKKYDVLITPFFLDCFTTSQLSRAGHHWKNFLRDGGLWLFTDFVGTPSVAKNAFIGLMYRFFRLTAGIDTGKLPEYSVVFEGLKCRESQRFVSNMVESRVYVKSD